jgi:hypothetical protein
MCSSTGSERLSGFGENAQNQVDEALSNPSFVAKLAGNVLRHLAFYCDAHGLSLELRQPFADGPKVLARKINQRNPRPVVLRPSDAVVRVLTL